MTSALIAAFAQVGVDPLDDLGEVRVARRRALGDQPHDLLVALRVQGGEGEVLELPLDRVHAQPVGQRGEHLERLAGLALLLGRRQEAQRAHVVQPVGELDDQHAGVARHRHDHLADRLGLGRIAELDLVELGHAVDQLRDLGAELGRRSSSSVQPVSSTVSCSSAATRVVVSMPSSARIVATASGWVM